MTKYTGEELLGLKNNSHLSMSTFKWVIGLLIAIMLALFTTPFYKQEGFEKKLHDLHIEQVRTSARIAAIEIEMNTREQHHLELEDQLRHLMLDKYSPP